MSSAAESQDLKASGEPHRLSLASAFFDDQSSVIVDLPAGLSDIRGQSRIEIPIRRRRGELSRIRLRLPRLTPPGAYAANVRCGTKSAPILLEVAPYRRLKVWPAALRFQGQRGRDCAAFLTFANAGNVAVTLPERAHLGVYDDDGLEAAFAAAYRQETDDPLEMAKTFVRRLREGHGGLLQLRIDGGGPLLPGEQRTVEIVTRLRQAIKPGHSYHGAWKLEDQNLAVHVQVAKSGGESET